MPQSHSICHRQRPFWSARPGPVGSWSWLFTAIPTSHSQIETAILFCDLLATCGTTNRTTWSDLSHDTNKQLYLRESRTSHTTTCSWSCDHVWLISTIVVRLAVSVAVEDVMTALKCMVLMSGYQHGTRRRKIKKFQTSPPPKNKIK